MTVTIGRGGARLDAWLVGIAAGGVAALVVVLFVGINHAAATSPQPVTTPNPPGYARLRGPSGADIEVFCDGSTRVYLGRYGDVVAVIANDPRCEGP